MKKVFMMLLLMCWTSLFAAPFNRLIFLGDSLTDNGNLYRLVSQILPKSPPYYNGRFSNGPTWAEGVSKYYYDQSYMGSTNYAVGGATAIFHIPTGRFAAPTNLQLEIDRYLIDTAFSDRSQTLFSIWIGGNDYLFDAYSDPDMATSDVTDKIAWDVERLISYGGKYFLIFNLPDLSKTPFARDGLEDRLKILSDLHNQKLAAAVKNLVDNYPDVTIIYVNIFDIFNDVMTNPDKYNKKYHLNLTNVNEACWQGGYWLRNVMSPRSLEKELKQSMLDEKTSLTRDMDFKLISQFILNSPSIAESYSLGKLYQQGMMPCANADEHIFWDHIHPTAIVHSILSKIVLELLAAQLP